MWLLCGQGHRNHCSKAEEPEKSAEATTDCDILNEAMGVLGAIGVTYDDYISVDDAVATSESHSMAEIATGSIVIDNAHTSDGDDKRGLQEDLADSDSGASMGSGLPVEVCCPLM